jgi:hypothetical protein
MTVEYHLTLIVETIRAIRIGAPVSKGGVTLLLEPWPDLYWEAMDREDGLDQSAPSRQPPLASSVPWSDWRRFGRPCL